MQTAARGYFTYHTHASPESVRRDVRPELCFYDARVSVGAGDAATWRICEDEMDVHVDKNVYTPPDYPHL